MIRAVGIVGNVENIGLEGTKVKVEKTHRDRPVGLHRRAGVYAIGESVGTAMARPQSDARGRHLSSRRSRA